MLILSKLCSTIEQKLEQFKKLNRLRELNARNWKPKPRYKSSSNLNSKKTIRVSEANLLVVRVSSLYSRVKALMPLACSMRQW